MAWRGLYLVVKKPVYFEVYFESERNEAKSRPWEVRMRELLFGQLADATLRSACHPIMWLAGTPVDLGDHFERIEKHTREVTAEMPLISSRLWTLQASKDTASGRYFLVKEACTTHRGWLVVMLGGNKTSLRKAVCDGLSREIMTPVLATYLEWHLHVDVN